MTFKNDKLYYIGGVVRDEILGIKSLDTDFCYEGNAIEFAKKEGFNIIRENPSFGTVKILLNNNEVDIASTRNEIYNKKGHLPLVTKIGCPLIEDVNRRDFTINAIAKKTLNGELIDYTGGIEDIKNKKIRILHPKSFIDDPTRIIRGLKFSVRFGFDIEKHTREYQEQYLNNVNYDMSYFRLKKELISAFSLNKQEVFTKFVEQNMYKLLSTQKFSLPLALPIENIIKNANLSYPYMVYMGLFDLSNLPLTKAEKRIIEWVERLETEKPKKITPKESIIIHKLRYENV